MLILIVLKLFQFCSRLAYTKTAFSFTGLKAKNLKKGMFFQPHPYVKLRIGPDAQNISSPLPSQFSTGSGTLPGQQNLPHHGQSRRTQVLENTVDPTWDHEVCARHKSNF